MLFSRYAAFFASFAALVLMTCGIHAEETTGTEYYDVVLSNHASKEIAIGTLMIINGKSYELAIEHQKFQDYFLSMKEMKCLTGPELWCHIPYPYDHPHHLNKDMRWLSHDLLFMYKTPDQFGANFWQGIYYLITPSENGFSGKAMAVDLNELAAPPPDPTQPMIDEQWLEAVSSSERWLPNLTIRRSSNR